MYSYIVGIQLLAVITCLVVITVIMFHKPFRGRHIFILLCLAITMHCFGYYLELTSSTVEAAVSAIKIQYLGISYINILYLFFLCDYFNIKRLKSIMLFFLAFNTMIFILVMTCDKHSLYYTFIEYSYDGIFPHVILGKGIFYHLFQTEVLIVNILISIVLVYRYIRCDKNNRKREFHFILASLCTCVTCALYGMGVFNIYDPSSSSYVISGLLMLIAIYKDQLFDVIHSARDLMIESMEEAFIVIDTKDCILDRNMSVVRLFPNLSIYSSKTKTGDISPVLEKLFQKKEDCKFRHEDRYYESHINNIYNGKEIVGYSALLIDITSTHEYTKKLISMRKQAEKANQAKSIFLANISHEIRTPLNAVLGMTELILNKNINEEVRDDALSIKSAGNTLLKLIDDILDLSKIESGKLMIHESKYQLMDVLNDVIRMTNVKLKDKPVSLHTNISKDIPLNVYGDETRIRQILLNILYNATKFTNHGEITFTVNSTYEKNHVNLEFIIKDTGCGIDKEDISKIFKSFERSKNAITNGVEGTGLGLAISKKIIETMGGTISVDSMYGVGSTFTIILPQKLYKKQEALETSSTINSENPISFFANAAQVLIVDDNALNLKVVSNLLKQFKINVVQAFSGEECLSILENKRFDIIFLDYMMPVLDGSETLQRIRQLDGCSPEELPVIVLTANAIAGVREQLLSEGFSDYLSKPINLHDLSSMLKKWLPANNLQDITLATKTTPVIEVNHTEDTLVLFDIGIQNCANITSYYIEALKIYCAENSSNIKSLTDSLRNNDLKQFEIQIHGIKSAVKTLGAISLSKQAAELEMAAHNNDIETVNNLIEQFLSLNVTVVKEFQNYINATSNNNLNVANG